MKAYRIIITLVLVVALLAASTGAASAAPAEKTPITKTITFMWNSPGEYQAAVRINGVFQSTGIRGELVPMENGLWGGSITVGAQPDAEWIVLLYWSWPTGEWWNSPELEQWVDFHFWHGFLAGVCTPDQVWPVRPDLYRTHSGGMLRLVPELAY